MSFFDSPVARCELARELVLTDETQAECAREHDCPPGRICPLCNYFVQESDRDRDGIRKADPVPPRHKQ